MNDPIVRQSLTRQVAGRLEAEIFEGLWTDQLPGTRTLAGRYGVNRKTCVAAMELLERRGMLSPARTGSARKITGTRGGQRAPNELSPARLLIINNERIGLTTPQEHFLQDCRHVWENTRGGVIRVSVDFDRNPRRVGRILKELISRHQGSALFLFRPTAHWSEIGSQRLPTFQAGGELRQPPCKPAAATKVVARSRGRHNGLPNTVTGASSCR